MKLIDKSALVAEIQKLRAKNKVSIFDKIPFKPNYEIGQKIGAYGALGLLLDIIDTLEVKEVDLEKEISKYIAYNICPPTDNVKKLPNISLNLVCK